MRLLAALSIRCRVAGDSFCGWLKARLTVVPYRTFADMAKAARDIAGAGYEGIEVFDGNVLDGEADDFAAMRAIFAETTLKLVAVYNGANFIYSDIYPLDGAKQSRAFVEAKMAKA